MKNSSITFYCYAFLILVPLYACNTLEGHRGISRNIQEAKERNVFIAAYMPPSNPYVINDSINLFVKSAWLERKWHYTKRPGESEAGEGFRLVVQSDAKSLKNYYKHWTIGLDYTRYFEVNPTHYMLHMAFDSLPSGVETFKVQKGNYLQQEGRKEIIGELVLTRESSQ